MPIRQRITIALLLAALALAACGPEDGRARGGGEGADGGNRPAQLQPQSKVFNGQSQ
jgi:hypothetical protein